MNIIDIASWQRGIDLGAVFAANPLDGVVVKATEGTGYVNPFLDQWADYLVKNGKPLGLYHFLSGQNATGEAAYFVQKARPYIGKAILCADYEAPATDQGTGYLKDFLDAVTELTGVRPLVYCSLSVVQGQNFRAIADAGYRLWVAQYASTDIVIGFQEHPWQQGSVAPFSGYVMHQYSGNGRLKGYDGAVDLNLWTGSYSAWLEMAKGGAEPPALKPADPEIVARVIDGEFDCGEVRWQRLRELGYDPDSVQSMVNTCYGIALSCKKYLKGYENYAETIAKITRVL